MLKNLRSVLFLLGSFLVVACGSEVEPGPEASEAPGTGVSRTSSALAAPESLHSAWRDPSRSWKEYADNYRRAMLGLGVVAAATVLDSAVPVASANFANVPVWTDAEIKAEFRATRDSRFTFALGNPSFPRRNSWLFPDNGCFDRAELLASMVGDKGKVKPYKLFSFGDLLVQTNNHPSGFVTWWFHVVPIVKSATSGTVYVLDPAIEPSQPLEWQSWLLRQVSALSAVQVTVADSNAYLPSSLVSGGANQRAVALAGLQNEFLDLEWARQETDLSRDAASLLGDKPPWGPERFYFVGADSAVVISACWPCLSGPAPLSQLCAADCP